MCGSVGRWRKQYLACDCVFDATPSEYLMKEGCREALENKRSKSRVMAPGQAAAALTLRTLHRC